MAQRKEIKNVKRMEKLLYPSSKITLKDKLDLNKRLSNVKKKLSKANKLKKRYIKVNRDFESDFK